MSLRNIFSRTEEVPVPEIEVDADRIRIPQPESGSEPDAQNGVTENSHKPRDLKLPKTTWF